MHVATATSADMVKCIACDKHLDGWDPTDNPLKFHKAGCSFVAALENQEKGAGKKEEEATPVVAAAPATTSRSARGSRRLTRASIASAALYKPEDAAEAAVATNAGDTPAPEPELEPEPELDPEQEVDDDATPVKAKPAKKVAKTATARKSSRKGKGAGTSHAAAATTTTHGNDEARDAAGAVDADATPVAAATTKKKVVTKAALSKLEAASPVADITVEEHLKNEFEAEKQTLTFSCEERMRDFRKEAANVREVLRNINGDATNVA